MSVPAFVAAKTEAEHLCLPIRRLHHPVAPAIGVACISIPVRSAGRGR
jgi:hypothetical protein